MKVGDLVKLKETYWEVKNAANLRGLVVEANCHPDEPKDDEDVVVVWNRITWTGIRGEYSRTVTHMIAEVEVVNESG